MSLQKAQLKQGLSHLAYAVDRISRGNAVLGIVGVMTQVNDYTLTKINTVTFNRCLLQVVKGCVQGILSGVPALAPAFSG